jgi:glutathione peroxidase
MTFRQKALKTVYPLFAFFNTLLKKNSKTLKSNKLSQTNFYSLKAILNNGETLHFDSVKNKKVLLVNTASDCGFTRQYDGLQELHEKYKAKLEVIGFPANDFGAQEKAADETIAEFCKVNFGVTFPLAKKSTVIKSANQNEVYQWLTDENKNGWNYVAPSWNFCKYLVDENGNLTHFFEAAVEPMSPEMIAAIIE